MDALCQKDWEASKKFHGYLVGLYADYNPDKLLQFLKSSDYYPIQASILSFFFFTKCKQKHNAFLFILIQEALETCTNHVRELVDERIYILARMSNAKEALRLITSESYDIHKAVEFCKVMLVIF